MPEDCPPTMQAAEAAAAAPAAIVIAHAEALAELATLLQHAPDREQLEELVHGLLALAHRVARRNG